MVKTLVVAFFVGSLLLVPTVSSGAVTSEVSVNDTVMAALRSSRALKAVQENRQAALHEVTRSKAGWGPRVDISAGAGASYLSDSTTRSYGSDRTEAAGNIGTTLTQPLWDGRATRSRVSVSEFRVESLDKRVLDNATTWALEGIIAHVDLIRRRQIVAFAEENVRWHVETLESQETRMGAGASSVGDVTQTEGRLARARSELFDVQAALQEAEAAYTRATGLPAPERLAPVALPVPVYDDPDVVEKDALAGNPKLAAYMADIKMAQGEQELARSAFQPVVNLEAGPRYADRGGKGSQWSSSMDAMLVLRWNVFNSGADEAGVEVAAARKRQTREEMMDFVDILNQEIRNTWARYLSAKQQEVSYARAVKYNQETLTVFLEQFVLGQRSLIDVLDTENELFNSSSQHATASGNILVGAYRLCALSGQLLPRLEIDPSFLYATIQSSE